MRVEPELRIAPAPSEREREAIARAVARRPGPAHGPADRSPWWREGVRESVSPPETPSPRG